MSDKIPCKECSALILPSTGERTGGLCMPCKNGTRKSMEASKESYRRERELDKTCPYRALWKILCDKVYDKPNGFYELSENERIYFAVNVLSGEVYNGGFEQFFGNSSGEYYAYADLGLMRISASSSLRLLRKAKEIAFGDNKVPDNQGDLWGVLKKLPDESELDALDTEFYKDDDQLDQKLEKFAIDTGLIEND